MKKSKFLFVSLVSMVLLGFSLFFVPAKVKANEVTELWGAPEVAQNYMDRDNKGIRLYVLEVTAEDSFFTGAYMCAVKDYEFNDGTELEADVDYFYGREWFNTDLIDGYFADYIIRWGSGGNIPEWDRTYVYFDVDAQQFVFEWYGKGYWNYWMERTFDLIEENDNLREEVEENYWDGHEAGYEAGYGQGYDDGRLQGWETGREYGYSQGYIVGYDEGQIYGYNVGRESGYNLGHEEGQRKGYTIGYDEGYGKGYNEGIISGYDSGFEDGIESGYEAGYHEGILVGESEAYEKGYSDGQKSKVAENNEKFYNGIEKWLVPAIITVILLGGFVSIAVRKRKEE